MSASEELDVDRLRIKFPRTYKALVALYPALAWDGILRTIEEAMERGRTAYVVAGSLSILRGLDRSTRRWVVLNIQADRKEVMIKQQRSFLTVLFDRSLDDILAELRALENGNMNGGTRLPPQDQAPRGFVFVSHHSKTTGKLALGIAEGLEKLGSKCWVAPRDIPAGAKWNPHVYSATQRCGAMVVLLNESAMSSPYLEGEVHIAMARRVPVIAVRLEDVDPLGLSVGLAAYQHLDCFGRSSLDGDLLSRRLDSALRAYAYTGEAA